MAGIVRNTQLRNVHRIAHARPRKHMGIYPPIGYGAHVQTDPLRRKSGRNKVRVTECGGHGKRSTQRAAELLHTGGVGGGEQAKRDTGSSNRNVTAFREGRTEDGQTDTDAAATENGSQR